MLADHHGINNQGKPKRSRQLGNHVDICNTSQRPGLSHLRGNIRNDRLDLFAKEIRRKRFDS